MASTSSIRRALLALCVVGAVALGPARPTAEARPGAASSCPAAAVELTAEPLSELSWSARCPRGERTVTHEGLGLPVPRRGAEGTIHAVYPTHRDSLTLATSATGEVSVVAARPPVTLFRSAAAPGGCADSSYDYPESHIPGPERWFLGDGARPRGISTSAVAAELRAARSAVVTADDCGLSDLTSLSLTYAGAHWRESEMTQRGGETHCDRPEDQDGVNIVDFGDLAGDGRPPLAVACVWTEPHASGSRIASFDIRFNVVDAAWTIAPGASSCRDPYDLRAVATHEFGHGVGLSHVAESAHPNLTMSTRIGPCDGSARSLARQRLVGSPTRVPGQRGARRSRPVST